MYFKRHYQENEKATLKTGDSFANSKSGKFSSQSIQRTDVTQQWKDE